MKSTRRGLAKTVNIGHAKAHPSFSKGGHCGERGIRTPGPVTVNGFQDRRIRPLCHLSGAKVRA